MYKIKFRCIRGKRGAKEIWLRGNYMFRPYKPELGNASGGKYFIILLLYYLMVTKPLFPEYGKRGLLFNIIKGDDKYV